MSVHFDNLNGDKEVGDIHRQREFWINYQGQDQSILLVKW